MRRRLDHRLAGVALAVAMTVSACGGTPPTAEQAAMPVVAPTPAPLENGLYAVWGAAPDEASAHAAAGTQAHRVVAYDDRLGGETPAPPREFLALSPEVDVPFVLASAPSVGESDKGFASLEVMRPGVDRPHSITMIPWARSVAALEWAGVWPHVVSRLEGCGDESTLAEARRALRQLRSLELVELREAITGRQYRTIWRTRAEETS